jgi:hypothetical protein
MSKRVTFAVAILLTFVALSLAAAQIQQNQAAPPAMGDMMKMQQMMADMKSGDAKLDELVGAMNAATGEAKVSAIAQTVTELVRQQKAMHGHMGMMMDRGMMMPMMDGRGTTKK